MKPKTWKISKDRPEEIFETPEKYYTEEEVENYSKSGGIKRTQERIAYRILEFLNLEKGKLLDIGCGPGFTAEAYKKEGFDVLGIDIIENMLKKAREKGLNVKNIDIKNINFENEFDAVISASALQWVKEKRDMENIAKKIYNSLKENGKIAIQFYPKSEEDLEKTAKIFKKAGFKGGIIIDNPENSMKRVCYIVMKKL